MNPIDMLPLVLNHNALMAFALAVSHVESGGNPNAVGRAGERGMYQFSQARWTELTRENFDRAFEPEIASAVFFVHVQELTNRFAKQTGRNATPGEIYAMHNYGFHGFERKGFHLFRCAKAVQRRAKTVEEMYLKEVGRN